MRASQQRRLDAVSDAEVAELAEIGESRAQQGVSIEVVLWGGGSA
jgi:hypothetical protein